MAPTYHEPLKCSTGADIAVSCDTDAIASNGVYTAFPWKFSGTIAAITYGDYKKFDQTQPLIRGHKGIVTDLAFSPFADNLLASGSADNTIKLWQLSQENVKDNQQDALVTLSGHGRPLSGLAWHHIAKNTLATTS